jgi:hypothetical protein
MPNNKSIDKKIKLKKERQERRIIRVYRGPNNILRLVAGRHLTPSEESNDVTTSRDLQQN